jgi:hypothetical protein
MEDSHENSGPHIWGIGHCCFDRRAADWLFRPPLEVSGTKGQQRDKCFPVPNFHRLRSRIEGTILSIPKRNGIRFSLRSLGPSQAARPSQQRAETLELWKRRIDAGTDRGPNRWHLMSWGESRRCRMPTRRLANRALFHVFRQSSSESIIGKDYYREVWNKQMSEVAKEYGVSTPTIGSRCRHLHIPIPSPGHWLRLRTGLPVQQRPPLPEIQIIEEEKKEWKSNIYSVDEIIRISQRISDDVLARMTQEDACREAGIAITTYRFGCSHSFRMLSEMLLNWVGYPTSGTFGSQNFPIEDAGRNLDEHLPMRIFSRRGRICSSR